MTATTEQKRYSQNDEELYILSACKDIAHGKFLDIGAWSYWDKSNTRALFELGWTGVLVEPSPKCVAGIAKEYYRKPGMVVVAAVCRPLADAGMYPMLITDDGLSTQSEANAEKWREVGGFHSEIYVPAVTIPGLLSQFGAFDFVSIDTEGSSVDLFMELLRTQMFPKCICVEHDGRTVEAAQAAHQKGYVQIYCSGENLVFARP